MGLFRKTYRVKNVDGNVLFEAKASNIKECIEHAIVRRMNFIRADFHGKNLSGVDLAGLNLRGANFEKTNLKG
ncbi:MAG: pentapeptide repeat-containing protein, partial [Alphaproteobacteria bacterium]|nr:pentapeptide repeat-containing protein [Alphaproteobacteria bacterium]